MVVAHWKTTADSLETVLGHLAALRPQALAEAGCLGYETFQDVDDASAIVLIERYRDRSALDAHLNSAHYLELVVGRIRPLLTERRVNFLRETP
ncbi:putative quinol monooxygenase [Mycolicibacterium sp. BiH015]|nr:putative quinol monooxygenase [Mycolicibacterium sp. BiH015]